MIIVRLSGGLGNQMFQYAAAYSCARRCKTKLVADFSLLNNRTVHNGYELDRVFGLNLREVSQNELKNILGILTHDRVKKWVTNGRLAKFRPKSLVLEPHFHYWQGFSSVGDNSYLQGYWQSDKYFHGYESELRKQFQFKRLLDEENKTLAKKIADDESVSLHVRKGDYISNSNNAQIHNVDLTDYYGNAIEYMTRQLDGPIFYVFTDDPTWVSDKMNLPKNHVLVSLNYGLNSFFDMYLMSQCKNHILANSTFSWWGSWLNKNKSKLVVCPKHWFTEEGMKTRNPCDLYPKGSVIL